MDVLAGLGAAWALGGGAVAPGLLVVRLLGVGRSRLERAVIALAVGRIVLGALALLATSIGARWLLVAWPFAATAAWALLAWRRHGRAPAAGALPRGAGAAVAVGLAASALLLHAVVARGGLEGADGALLFHGRDSTNDPLVYAAMALHLHVEGLPMTRPFAGGAPGPTSLLPYGVLAGLHGGGGVPMLDLVFRVVPAYDVACVAAGAAALVLALGGPPLAAGLGAALTVLGGGPSFLLEAAGGLVGRTLHPIDAWALFGPYLLAFNPIAPALHTLFAAVLLLLSLRPGRRREAILAGALLAALLELKAFLWLPVVGAAVLVALLRPPAAAARGLRGVALTAVLLSVPSLVEKMLWWLRPETAGLRGVRVCAGCLPRYLIDASLDAGAASFAALRSFRHVDLLEPGMAARTVLAVACVLAIALGARAVALPVLWQGARAAAPADDAAACARVAACRLFGLAALLGLALSLSLTVAPHYLNGFQLAWIATFGLWPFAALQLGRWVAERQLAWLGAALLLALPGTADVLLRLGYGAPVSLRVSAPERALLERLREVSEPGDVVVEPSMLADPDVPSPIPWLAARPVSLSLLSAVQELPRDELDQRFDRLVRIYLERDRASARRALAGIGASFVYVPRGWDFALEGEPRLEVVADSSPGVLYRVRGAR